MTLYVNKVSMMSYPATRQTAKGTKFACIEPIKTYVLTRLDKCLKSSRASGWRSSWSIIKKQVLPTTCKLTVDPWPMHAQKTKNIAKTCLGAQGCQCSCRHQPSAWQHPQCTIRRQFKAVDHFAIPRSHHSFATCATACRDKKLRTFACRRRHARTSKSTLVSGAPCRSNNIAIQDLIGGFRPPEKHQLGSLFEKVRKQQATD